MKIIIKSYIFIFFISICGMSCDSTKTEEVPLKYTKIEKLNDKSAKIYVRVVVNDSIKGLFLLDNGSSHCIIDSSFFYKNFNKNNFNISKQHPSLWMEQCIGKMQFTIGNYTFSVNYSEIENLKRLHPDLNGILGIEAFKNKITLIDFDSNQIAFVDTLSVPSNYYKIPLLPSKTKGDSIYKRYIHVTGFQNEKGDNVDGNFLFDLGASGGLSLKHSFITKIKKGTPLEKVAKGGQMMMTKVKFKAQVYIVDSLSICGIVPIKEVHTYITFSDELPNFYPLDEMLEGGDGLLGIKILSQFNLIYDEKNNLLFLKVNSNNN